MTVELRLLVVADAVAVLVEVVTVAAAAENHPAGLSNMLASAQRTAGFTGPCSQGTSKPPWLHIAHTPHQPHIRTDYGLVNVIYPASSGLTLGEVVLGALSLNLQSTSKMRSQGSRPCYLRSVRPKSPRSSGCPGLQKGSPPPPPFVEPCCRPSLGSLPLITPFIVSLTGL